MGTELSDEEFWLLLQLMQRYTETSMDQWDNWQLGTAYGPVYVRITRELAADEPEQAYRTVPIPLAARYRTGRPAHASNPEGVTSRVGLVRFIDEMSADLAARGAAEWENATLGRFLDALARFLADSGRVGRDDDGLTWAAITRALMAATGYE